MQNKVHQITPKVVPNFRATDTSNLWISDALRFLVTFGTLPSNWNEQSLATSLAFETHRLSGKHGYRIWYVSTSASPTYVMQEIKEMLLMQADT